jgi:hypothetical protein
MMVFFNWIIHWMVRGSISREVSLLKISLSIGNSHILKLYCSSLYCALFNCIIDTFVMSQSSIPGRKASHSPTLTETTLVIETDLATTFDPGDNGSIYRAPRAS